MEPEQQHLSDEALTALLDGELAGFEGVRARNHLEACAACREREAELEQLGLEYAELHQQIKAIEPPARWKTAEELLPRTKQRRIAVWLPAAAAVVLAALLFWRMDRPQSVSAAEVLAKAVSAERTETRTERRLMVRTRRATFFRPAVYTGEAGDPELRALFQAAQYDWSEPLSARAYTAWRQRLPQKEDSAERLSEQKVFRVRTLSSAGPLAEATLTVRETDYRPISASWHFRPDEWVEITEVDPATETRMSTETAPAVTSSAPLLHPVARELRVWEALRSAGADLGDPVEVVRDANSVTVRLLGLEEERERQIRAALSGIAGVQIVSVASEAPQEPASTVIAEGSPALQDLRQRLGEGVNVEDFINDALDASDSVLAQAHALDRLKTHFPADVAEALSPEDADRLNALRSAYAQALARNAAALRQRLSVLLPAAPPARGTPLGIAQRVDASLNAMLAGGRAMTEAELAQVSADIAALESLR